MTTCIFALCVYVVHACMLLYLTLIFLAKKTLLVDCFLQKLMALSIFNAVENVSLAGKQ